MFCLEVDENGGGGVDLPEGQAPSQNCHIGPYGDVLPCHLNS